MMESQIEGPPLREGDRVTYEGEECTVVSDAPWCFLTVLILFKGEKVRVYKRELDQ